MYVATSRNAPGWSFYRKTFSSARQIIHRCCAAIDLGAIFDGDIENAMTALNASRACGVEWKVRGVWCQTSAGRSARQDVPAHHLTCDALRE